MTRLASGRGVFVVDMTPLVFSTCWASFKRPGRVAAISAWAIILDDWPCSSSLTRSRANHLTVPSSMAAGNTPAVEHRSMSPPIDLVPSEQGAFTAKQGYRFVTQDPGPCTAMSKLYYKVLASCTLPGTTTLRNSSSLYRDLRFMAATLQVECNFTSCSGSEISQGERSGLTSNERIVNAGGTPTASGQRQSVEARGVKLRLGAR